MDMASTSKTLSKNKVNFLEQFRKQDEAKFNRLTAAQFMTAWNHYDKDGKGTMHPLPILLEQRSDRFIHS